MFQCGKCTPVRLLSINMLQKSFSRSCVLCLCMCVWVEGGGKSFFFRHKEYKETSLAEKEGPTVDYRHRLDEYGTEISNVRLRNLYFTHLATEITQLVFESFPSRMLSAGWIRAAVPGLHTKIIWGALKNTDARAPPQQLIQNLQAKWLVLESYKMHRGQCRSRLEMKAVEIKLSWLQEALSRAQKYSVQNQRMLLWT